VLYKNFFLNNKVFRRTIGDHIQWVLYITRRDHYITKHCTGFFLAPLCLRVYNCLGEALYITYCDIKYRIKLLIRVFFALIF
jgi:hypothetical protein